MDITEHGRPRELFLRARRVTKCNCFVKHYYSKRVKLFENIARYDEIKEDPGQLVYHIKLCCA